jgi:hypothetical protein
VVGSCEYGDESLGSGVTELVRSSTTLFHMMWFIDKFKTYFVSMVCYIGKFYFKDFLNCHFELSGENCENDRYRTNFTCEL